MKEKDITEKNSLLHAKTLLYNMLTPLDKDDKKELLKLLLALTKGI